MNFLTLNRSLAIKRILGKSNKFFEIKWVTRGFTRFPLFRQFVYCKEDKVHAAGTLYRLEFFSIIIPELF